MGELAALATAFCWAVTTTTFEYSGKRIGTMNLNLMRLLIGLAFICIFTFATRGMPFPTDANISIWLWLALSGIIGLVIGDLLLLEALILIGARITMLIYASTPIFSGLFAWVILGEAMTMVQIIGMFVTFGGIILVMFTSDKSENKVKLAHPLLGVLFALGATIAQSVGYVIGKLGMADYNAFSSTQIRIIAAIFGFAIIFAIKGQFKDFFQSFKDTKALGYAAIGSFFGPFLGVSLSLYAVQRINPGVASTLMSITPIILLVYAMVVKKDKIVIREIIGSIVAILGLVVMFV